MEKFIEKFTFYDILGYGLPGFLFLIISSWIFSPEFTSKLDIGFFTNDVVLVLSVLAGSHVIGSLFSELGHYLFKGRGKVCPERTTIVQEAEKKSGLFDNIELEKCKKKDEEKVTVAEIRKMYGDLQIDGSYSRLHNYSSVEVMCKNTAVSFFVTALLAVLYGLCTGNKLKMAAGILLFFLAYIMLDRAVRFGEKTREYTVMWFVNKYK